MTRHRVQMTVFLEPEVHKAAKQRAGEMKLSLSATVAEAAKESLLSSYRSDREKELLKAAERNFHAVRRLEQRMRVELQILKELIGLGMRSFFNHIPPIPDSGKASALVSGKQRFQRYLDLVASNLRGGDSVLGDVPLQGAADAEGAAANPTNCKIVGKKDHQSAQDEESGRTASVAHPTSRLRSRGHSHVHHENSLFETST